MLSTRFKESFKTALAMAIAYGIALSMDWDNPKWAGVAVAVISLATVGQSLNKAALRIFGTLIAAAVGLMIIALSAQDRWLFMLLLSTWVGLCTYMMARAKHQYLWHVGGFVVVIISVEAALSAGNAFDVAVLRAQETGLGILVFSLVSVLVWPSNSQAKFEAAVGKLASTQHQLFTSYFGLMKGEGGADDARALKNALVQQQTGAEQLLDAAETDSYEVWELRQQWRRYRRQAAELASTLERWRESFAEVQGLALERLVPNLKEVGAELEDRFAALEHMLAGQTPGQPPQAMELTLDKAQVQALSHFHQAALTVCCSQLRHLEALTRSLFDSVADIKGFGQAVAVAESAPGLNTGMLFDPDRLAGVVRITVIMWLVFLAAVYVPDIPGGFGILNVAAPFGMILATTPHLQAKTLFTPAMVSILFAGLLYIFVMPQLSSFLGLGLMLFAVSFAICYLFASPKQALGRVFGLVMLVVVTGISNQQSYSFSSVANTAMMFPLVFLVLALSTYFPFDLRPQWAFQRLLARFFRSSDYLLSTMRHDPDRVPTRLDRWRRSFHAHQLASLPRKLGAWALHIDARVLPSASPQAVQALVTDVQSLSFRMEELLEARAKPHAEFIIEELLHDIRAWRLRVREAFQRLSGDTGSGDVQRARATLGAIVERLELRVEESLNKATEEQLSRQDREHFYRLLGAFRGLSETTVQYVVHAAAIDWGRWREARF